MNVVPGPRYVSVMGTVVKSASSIFLALLPKAELCRFIPLSDLGLNDSYLLERNLIFASQKTVYCSLETLKGRIFKNVLIGDTSLGMYGVSRGDYFKGGSDYWIVYVVAFIL